MVWSKWFARLIFAKFDALPMPLLFGGRLLMSRLRIAFEGNRIGYMWNYES